MASKQGNEGVAEVATSPETKKKTKKTKIGGFLDSIIKDPSACADVITPEMIRSGLTDRDLLDYSLLILSLLGKLVSGLTTTEAEEGSQQPPQSKKALLLLDAFLSRIQTNRVLKLRVALLLGLGNMKDQWNVRIKYTTQQKNTTKTTTASSSISSSGVDNTATTLSITAQDLLLPNNNSTTDAGSNRLKEYAAERFFHPTFGIRLKDKKRALRLLTISKAFSKQYAVLWIMQDLNVNKSEASDIFDAMENQNLLQLVVPNTKLACAAGLRGGTFAGLGNALYQPTTLAANNNNNDDNKTPTTDGEEISEGSFPSGTTTTTKTTTTEEKTGGGGDNDTRSIVIPMDVLDIQSLKFWRDALWQKTPLTEGHRFESSTVVHPMVSVLSTADSSSSSLVHSIAVQKVFDSMAQPAFLKLSSYREGSIIEDIIIPTTAGATYATTEALSLQEKEPRVIAKNGDNLLNDAGVELLFRIFTHIWENDDDGVFDDDDGLGEGMRPFAYDYDVLPCGPRVGLLGCLDGLEPLNDFDWNSWTVRYKDDAAALQRMCCSAAGCSIATYVLGCGDRHWDNIQICDNGKTLLHIDFGMILGENPAFKTPRFSISQGQERAFRDVGIWEQFVALSSKAFLSLRKRGPGIMNLAALILDHTGRSQSRILKYLASEQSLNLGREDDAAAAAESVTQQIRDSSRHWETIARKFTHDRIDPLFFKAVQKAPPKLVAAVEKMYDKT